VPGDRDTVFGENGIHLQCVHTDFLWDIKEIHNMEMRLAALHMQMPAMNQWKLEIFRAFFSPGEIPQISFLDPHDALGLLDVL
jgi:hypothetical protein